MRSLIFVFDEKTNWRAQCNAQFETGLEVNQVFFVSLSSKIDDDDHKKRLDTYWGGKLTLTWPSTAELYLNVFGRQFQALPL